MSQLGKPERLADQGTGSQRQWCQRGQIVIFERPPTEFQRPKIHKVFGATEVGNHRFRERVGRCIQLSNAGKLRKVVLGVDQGANGGRLPQRLRHGLAKAKFSNRNTDVINEPIVIGTVPGTLKPQLHLFT